MKVRGEERRARSCRSRPGGVWKGCAEKGRGWERTGWYESGRKSVSMLFRMDSWK